jgi:hypothetical protein
VLALLFPLPLKLLHFVVPVKCPSFGQQRAKLGVLSGSANTILTIEEVKCSIVFPLVLIKSHHLSPAWLVFAEQKFVSTQKATLSLFCFRSLCQPNSRKPKLIVKAVQTNWIKCPQDHHLCEECTQQWISNVLLVNKKETVYLT